MKSVINQLPAGVCMKTVLLVLMLAVAGQAVSVDHFFEDVPLTGKHTTWPKLYLEYGTLKMFHVAGGGPRLSNKARVACNKLRKAVRPDTTGVLWEHVQSGLPLHGDNPPMWQEYSLYLDMDPDSLDTFKCYAERPMAGGRCWNNVKEGLPGSDIDFVSGPEEADRICRGDTNQFMFMPNPESYKINGFEMTGPANYFPASVGVLPDGSCDQAFFSCQYVDPPGGKDPWPVLQIESDHRPCPEGEKGVTDVGGYFHCVNDDLYLGEIELRMRNPNSCKSATQGETLTFKAANQPPCVDGVCPGKYIYAIADWRGKEHPQGFGMLPDGSGDAAIRVQGIERIDFATGRLIKEWPVEIGMQSFGLSDGRSDFSGEVYGIFITGGGEILNTWCANFNAL